MLNGYDISNLQGDLDIADLDNPAFVIAKVTQDSSFKDKHFQRHKARARELGILFGGYHYGDPTEQPNPRASVDFYLDTYGDQEYGEIGALDVEKNTGEGGFEPGDNSDWVYGWGAAHVRLAGYKAKLYVSRAGILDFGLNKNSIAEVFDLWYAYWLDDPNQTTPPVSPYPFQQGFKLWQYNADVIDKDRWLGTPEEWQASGKQNASNTYESKYWTPMQKLLDDMIANSTKPHADAAFHACVSNAITLHKIAHGVEPAV